MESATVTALKTSIQEWVKLWDEADAANVPLPLSYRFTSFDGEIVDFPLTSLGKKISLIRDPPSDPFYLRRWSEGVRQGP